MEIKMTPIKTVLLLLAMTLSTNSLCFAAQHSLGFGVGVTPDYEGSEDNQTIPMLMLSGRYDSGRSFALTGPKLKVDLLPNRNYSLGPIVNYNMGRSDVDNSQVDALKDIDGTLEAGVIGGINYNNWAFGLELLKDILDEHGGMKVQVSTGYRWQATEQLSILPGISFTYADEDYMQTFFGVNSSNRGSSALPDYSADSGLKDVGTRILANYTARGNWGLSTILSYTVLLNDAKDSPIVDGQGDDKQMFFGVMATYRWAQ
jgi:outer membrane scaffolding protein for murein synthesis (MipA/OmpV family)